MGTGTTGDPYTVKQSGGDFTTLDGALQDSGTAANEFIEIQGTWTIDDTANATVSDKCHATRHGWAACRYVYAV